MGKILISILPVFAALLMFLLLLIVFGRHPPEVVFSPVREFKGMLSGKKKNEGLPEKIQGFFLKNGAAYHYGKQITPIKLVAFSCFAGMAIVLVLARFNLAFGIAIGTATAILPWIMLPMLNKHDNEKMLQDLRMIYHALSTQIKAGVYVTDALSELYTEIENKRLKDAFLDLSGDIVMKADMFGALEKFQEKFDNRYIDSLCITLLQAMESGQAVELLADIADQVRDMEKAVLEKRKGRLDRSITFYQLGMLSCVLAVALYACINYMMLSATNM